MTLTKDEEIEALRSELAMVKAQLKAMAAELATALSVNTHCACEGGCACQKST